MEVYDIYHITLGNNCVLFLYKLAALTSPSATLITQFTKQVERTLITASGTIC